MDISGRLQNRMWEGAKLFLDKNRELPPKELVKKCFLWMFGQLEKFPMLMMVDRELTEHLYRKLPPEVVQAHTKEDAQALLLLGEYGVRFKCEINLAASTMQVLALALLNLWHENGKNARGVIEIMLSGVVNELVE